MLDNYALNNPFFEIDTSWLLNLLKLLIFLKWLKRLQKQNLTMCKRLYKSRKKCSYFYCLPNKHKIFHLFWLCLKRFMENLCTAPTVIAFMVRDVMALIGIFSIFLLAGPVILMVLFIDLSLISKQVFYITKSLFFVLIPWYNCFRVTY